MSRHNYLNVEDARRRIEEMGFGEVTVRQVRRWSGERVLPFFKMGRSLYISEAELLAAFASRQTQALREVRR